MRERERERGKKLTKIKKDLHLVKRIQSINPLGGALCVCEGVNGVPEEEEEKHQNRQKKFFEKEWQQKIFICKKTLL